MVPEDGGPGAVEEPAAFLAEVSPGVEEVAGLVVANGEHATRIAPPKGLARLFAGPSIFQCAPASAAARPRVFRPVDGPGLPGTRRPGAPYRLRPSCHPSEAPDGKPDFIKTPSSLPACAP